MTRLGWDLAAENGTKAELKVNYSRLKHWPTDFNIMGYTKNFYKIKISSQIIFALDFLNTK